MLWANGKLRFLVTELCNAKCPHCHNEGQHSKTPFMPVGLAEYIVRIAESSDERVRTATISGGEALLHPNLCSIVQALRRVTPRLTVSTNGLCLTEQVAASVTRAGCTRFRIDVDPYRLAGRAWSSGGIRFAQLRKVCALAGGFGASVELNSVLTSYTAAQLVDLLEFCTSYNFTIKFFERVSKDFSGRLQPAPDTPVSTLKEALGIASSGSGFVEIPRPDTKDIEFTNGSIGIRYCRFQCNEGKCYLSGTRFNADGCVSACMNSFVPRLIAPDEGINHATMVIARAVSSGCSVDSEG